jgi:hypothetical protein
MFAGSVLMLRKTSARWTPPRATRVKPGTPKVSSTGSPPPPPHPPQQAHPFQQQHTLSALNAPPKVGEWIGASITNIDFLSLILLNFSIVLDVIFLEIIWVNKERRNIDWLFLVYRVGLAKKMFNWILLDYTYCTCSDSVSTVVVSSTILAV